ncbi:hypothetical protein [Fodinicola feengrottensis]|uniref:Uncharacterized protein n=1 Tax=Fodinicola feengrottensis TaxID=435914 RepID=A0ABN2I211_9ACTN|nr:hypothetical protein [Fodinicola feengrottensis]
MHSVRNSRSSAVVVLLASLVLAFGAGCGSAGNGVGTSCTTSGCTVTFDQGVNAEANILGVKAKLVDVRGQQVTIEVAGHRVNLTAGAPPIEVGGLRVSVQEITAKNVVVHIAQS